MSAPNMPIPHSKPESSRRSSPTPSTYSTSMTNPPSEKCYDKSEIAFEVILNLIVEAKSKDTKSKKRVKKL